MPKHLSIQDARDYYGPSLTTNHPQQVTWSSDDQIPRNKGSNYNIALAALGTSAAASAGFIDIGEKNIWSYYTSFLRGVEEYSPGKILRTFQLSNMASQFEKRPDQFISPSLLQKNPALTEYYSQLIGKDDSWQKLVEHGLSIRKGRAYWGKTENVALKYANIITTPENASQYFGSGFARVVDAGEAFGKRVGGSKTPLAHVFFAKTSPVVSTPGVLNQVVDGMPAQVVGAHSIPQYLYRAAGAVATENISRFNRLLKAPAEMEPLATLFRGVQKISQKLTGKKFDLAVKETGGLRMLGSLSLKYGLTAGAIGIGYSTVDYLARKSTTLDNTIFSEGLTSGIATVGVKTNLAVSRLAEITGAHAYREKQEEIAPGSTEFSKLIAFPLIGAFGASIGTYAAKVSLMAKNQFNGMNVVAAREAAEETMDVFGGNDFLNRIGKALTTQKGIYSEKTKLGSIFRKIAHPVGEEALSFKLFGKIGPTKLAGLIGGSVGLAAILPFLPGALAPSKRPDELLQEYTGQKEVGIRKGRWWEFGGCLIKSNTYTLIDGVKKSSDQIQKGDRLIGRDHDVATVVRIWTKPHQGEIRKFSTAHDRDIFTGLTNNHIVPVYRDGRIQEIEARYLQPNDYVEIPFLKLEEKQSKLYVTDIIKSPVVVQNNRVYAAQKIWFSESAQKSGTSSIPMSIDLDYDLGLLFGYFLAEGNISFKNSNPAMVETVHAKSEYSYVLDIERIIAEKFGIHITKRFKTTGFKTKDGCWIVRICSAVVAKLFTDLFYDTEYKAKDKHVPIFALQAPKVFQEGLIEGYWRGDGHLASGARIITSARKGILEDIQTIALSHGQACGISKHSDGEFKAWRLYFYKQNYGNVGSIFVGDKLYSRIRSIIIEDYDDFVYDFEVSHPDHLFQAGTFLVHNSAFEGERIKYYRPHWYPRMLSRYKEKAIWGDDEPSPMRKWVTKELTYELEKKFYKSRPYPMCFHPETPVYTVNGFKEIQDIESGDLVLNKNGEWTSVLFKTKRDCTEKQLIEISIAADNRKLLVTPDHKILCLKNTLTYDLRGNRCGKKNKAIQQGRLEWIAAKNATRHDFVVIPINLCEAEINPILDLASITRRAYTDDRVVYDTRASQDLLDACLSELPTNQSAKKHNVGYKVLHQLKTRGGYKHFLPRYLEIDSELAYLFGLWLAEGWTTGSQVGFAFNLNEKETYAFDVLRIIKNKFNLNGTTSLKSENGISVCISSKILCEILEGFLGKHLANTKTIPMEVFAWPIRTKQALIKGLIRGDGSITKRHEVTFCSASSSLASQLRLLLLSLGISSSFRKIIPQENWKKSYIQGREIKRNVSYQLSISGTGFESFSRFEEEVAWEKTFGDRKGVIKDGYFYIPIRAVRSIPYEGQVFDITVQDEQSFLTTCIVHNSSLPFEEIPLIGPLLANTIGRIIKPPKLMHTEEWMRGDNTLSEPLKFDQRIASELGQTPEGSPVSPYRPDQALGEQIYRMTEMIGLTGFTATSIKEKLTGSADSFDQYKQLESARRIHSFERDYWDLELGGLLGGSEALRRLYPHKRNQIPLYNPIRNEAPSWLPGAGDKSPDFLHGDFYTKIQEGELRLPGAGYEARFPILKGVDPEDYPLIHRWKILADVAPYSKPYGQHMQMIRQARKDGSWTEYEESIYQQTISQIVEKKNSNVKIRPYKYLEPTGDIFSKTTHYGNSESSELLTQLNKAYAENREGQKGGVVNRLFGSYWELLSHNADTAMDSLTPISLGSKLVHERSPIESYEVTQVYGSNNAFWQHPYRDFLKPFISRVGKSMGTDGIPSNVEQIRNLESYFDILKYVKYSRLSNLAKEANDEAAVKTFETKKDETLFGVNPFTRNYSSIFRSLPKRDRDYFNPFVEVKTQEEKERILELIPKNEKALYEARWKLAFVEETKKAEKMGILTEAQSEEAKIRIQKVYDEAKTEGFPTSEELNNEYLKTRIQGESYPDWYRRTKLLPEYPLPPADWIGFSPSVDLEDIKLKVIENLGEDIHSYNLWPQRQMDSAYKPYIDDEAVEPILDPEELTRDEVRDRINEIFVANAVIPDVFTRTSFAADDEDDVEINIGHSPDPGLQRRY